MSAHAGTETDWKRLFEEASDLGRFRGNDPREPARPLG
jgi:hypothetical protein